MNMSLIIHTIQEYIDTCLKPRSFRSEKIQRMFFYSEWAANEILNRLIDEVSKLPPHITGVEPRSHIEIIQEFVDEMVYYYEICHTDENKLIYSSARITGIEILYLFK